MLPEGYNVDYVYDCKNSMVGVQDRPSSIRTSRPAKLKACARTNGSSCIYLYDMYSGTQALWSSEPTNSGRTNQSELSKRLGREGKALSLPSAQDFS